MRPFPEEYCMLCVHVENLDPDIEVQFQLQIQEYRGVRKK
jgi:hypothetical protein